MELIPINDSKLKIMLDESDMKELNICDEADCANNETRHAIRTILERAKNQIGFNTEGSEIFVQLYASRSGGCELFVTKGMSSNTSERNLEKRANKRKNGSKDAVGGECHLPSVRGDSFPKEKRDGFGNMIFSFDTLSELCAACKVLDRKKANYNSSAYLTDGGCCYLILENTNMSSYTRLDSLSFLHEYGKREHSDNFSTYLCEHGRLICSENAVETLCRF